jgi:hypothetical protein
VESEREEANGNKWDSRTVAVGNAKIKQTKLSIKCLREISYL